MTTSSNEAVHGAFAMVQRNVFAPAPSEETVDDGLEGVVIIPAPLINVHVPLPEAGVFPANIAEVAHTV